MRGRLIDQVWPYSPAEYAPARHRRGCRYEAFVPDPVAGIEFAVSSSLAGTVSEAEAAIRSLNAAAQPALRPLARLLLRAESIASSKVEGLQMTAREVARAEAKMEMGVRVGTTALEVVGNIEAMELAIEDASTAEAFSLEQILAIHGRLMARSNVAHIAGKVRTEQNWIGGNDHNPCGADFIPPPPEYMDDLLADLCRAMGEDVLPPLVQAAINHAQFETIHPFGDGNGRTGRALIHVVLRRRGVTPNYVPPISVILAAKRAGYIAGLTRFREGDVEGWIEHFAVAAARSAQLAEAYVAAVGELMDRWREQLGPLRTHAAAHAILEVLPAHPIITTTLAAAATSRARSAVHTGVEALENAGVLIPLTASRRNRSWEAAGLLDLLASLEAGQLPYGS